MEGGSPAQWPAQRLGWGVRCAIARWLSQAAARARPFALQAALAGVAQVMAQLHQLEEQAGLADALAARAAAAWRGAAPPCSLDFSE